MQGVEEALHQDVAAANCLAAHRCGDAGTGESIALGVGGILGAIGVVDQSGLRPSLLDGHRQCRGCEFDLHVISHGPSGQSRSRQAGTSLAGVAATRGLKCRQERGAGMSLERWMFAEAEYVP